MAAQKDFITLKAEVDKLNISKLVNVPTILNNVKTKVDDLDVRKLKTVPVELKKISDIVDKQVVQNTKFNMLKTKGNKIDSRCNNVNSHKSKKHR